MGRDVAGGTHEDLLGSGDWTEGRYEDGGEGPGDLETGGLSGVAGKFLRVVARGRPV